MRMATADTDPNNFRQTFWRKTTYTDDRQKKCAEFDGTQFFANL